MAARDVASRRPNLSIRSCSTKLPRKSPGRCRAPLRCTDR